MALVGFQGRGFADGVQPDFCWTLLREALTFQSPQQCVTLLGQRGSIRTRNPIRASLIGWAHSWCLTLPTIIHPRNLPQHPVGIAKVEFLAPIDGRLGFREIALQFLESSVDREVLNTDAKVVHPRRSAVRSIAWLGVGGSAPPHI